MGMLKWLIRTRLTAFEKRYAYDVGYARDLLAADARAFFAYAKLQGISRYRKDVPREVHFAVKLVGTMAEDCGSCTQLMVAMALEQGVGPAILSAVLRREDAALSEDVRLGVRFARASLAHSPEADALREAVVARWGERALISLAFGLAAARVFPTLKYALGHGVACQRVVVAGTPVAIGAAA
jgi:uncharacterized lipoprotein YbaY